LAHKTKPFLAAFKLELEHVSKRGSVLTLLEQYGVPCSSRQAKNFLTWFYEHRKKIK
jgi:hypothetical protein